MLGVTESEEGKTVPESIAVAQQFLYIQLCDILLFSKVNVSVSKVVFPSLLMSSSPRCEEVEIRAESRMTLVRSRKFYSPWDDMIGFTNFNFYYDHRWQTVLV